MTTPADVIAELFELSACPPFAPRYNIAPTQDVLAVIQDQPQGARVLTSLRWGLIPHWAKDPAIGNRMINARAETLAEKPSFRTSFKRRRCLIAADGFYEWKKEDSRKQPYLLGLRGSEPFAFAGLWESWSAPDGERVLSCTIITTQPNALCADIHNRMPVILPEEHYQAWLDPGLEDTDEVGGLLTPYNAEAMEAYAVSTHVNRPANDGPRCVERCVDPITR